MCRLAGSIGFPCVSLEYSLSIGVRLLPRRKNTPPVFAIRYVDARSRIGRDIRLRAAALPRVHCRRAPRRCRSGDERGDSSNRGSTSNPSFIAFRNQLAIRTPPTEADGRRYRTPGNCSSTEALVPGSARKSSKRFNGSHGSGHGRDVVESTTGHPFQPAMPRPLLYPLAVGEPPHGVRRGVGLSWSDVSSCNAVSAIWSIPLEIYCRTPISATRARGPMTYNTHRWPPTRGAANMRLGVVEPPPRVGWGGVGGESEWRVLAVSGGINSSGNPIRPLVANNPSASSF
jgi:hypothetical protein